MKYLLEEKGTYITMKKMIVLMFVSFLSLTSLAFAIEPVPHRTPSQQRRGEPVVVPGQRVGKFFINMTKSEIERLGTPQGVEHKKGQIIYTFNNDETGNYLHLYMTPDMRINNQFTVDTICFSNRKFDTIDGITIDNFDSRLRRGNTSGSNQFYDYPGGGLWFAHAILDSTQNRMGCVTR